MENSHLKQNVKNLVVKNLVVLHFDEHITGHCSTTVRNVKTNLQNNLHKYYLDNSAHFVLIFAGNL